MIDEPTADPQSYRVAAMHRLILSDVKPRQLLHAIVTLDIPDRLRDGPKVVDTVAQHVGADAAVLRRLLRGLVALDLLREDPSDTFQLTDGGRLLCRDDPSHLRGYVLNAGDRDHAWVALLHTVRTGETAFDHVHGHGLFDHVGSDPDRAAAFHQWMAAGSDSFESIATACPLPERGIAVDVGGGRGGLLAALLRREPTLSGVLYDPVDGVHGAAAQLEHAGILDRCTIVSGDFFTEVPAGADPYVLCRILHDWDDQRAGRILKRCGSAMSATATLLVIEKVMPERVADDPGVVFLDLDMLVEVGGSQRSVGQYRHLLGSAGLNLVQVVDRAPAPSVIVAQRRTS